MISLLFKKVKGHMFIKSGKRLFLGVTNPLDPHIIKMRFTILKNK